jgi:hypothetical protein
MKLEPEQSAPTPGGIEIGRLELSCLVGQHIKIYSSQFPGKDLRPRVLSITENQILVNSAGDAELLNSLVNNQTVIMQFPYKGQTVAINAQLKRSDGGRCYFIFDEKATPLSQRKYRRISGDCAVKLAAFPTLTFTRKHASHLRWVETAAVNFSSGGVLVELPTLLEPDAKLLLNVGISNELFPPLVLAKVRHGYSHQENRFRIGAEFLVRENISRQLSDAVIRQLPAVVVQYTARDREKLNKQIMAGTTLHDLAS